MYVATKNFETAIVDFFDYYLNKLKLGLVIGISGSSHLKSGVGKSYTGIRIGERLDKDYKEGTEAIEKIAFKPAEFGKAMEIVENKGRPQQVVCIDEAGILVNAKKWYTFINRGIADAVMTFRQLRSIACFVTPSISIIDRDIRLFVSHLGFCNKVLSELDSHKVEIRFYFYLLYWDETKTEYYKYRIQMYVRELERLVKFNYFKVNHPENLELIEEYEKKAKVYKSEVRRSVLELDKIEKSLNEYVMDILEKKEIISDTPKGKIVYPEDVRDKYGVTFATARLIARRVNEKLKGM